MYKYDYYTNYNCVSGNCPLMVEEEKYGIRSSTCDDYCGTGLAVVARVILKKVIHVMSVYITRRVINEQI